MNQSTESGQPLKSSGRPLSRMGIGLIIIAVVSLAAAGFAVLNPHGTTTVTQQQTFTILQTSSVVQGVMVNSAVTVVSLASYTVPGGPASAPYCGFYGCGYGNSNPNCGTSTCAYPNCDSNGCSFQLCGSNGCTFASPAYTTQQQCGFNGCPYSTCLTGQGNSVQCAGYLQNNNGCVELVIPVTNYAIGAGETSATWYYTMQNLPASYPPVGSWVTVNGQLNVGRNTGSNGAACPGNYINVSSLTQP